MAMPLSLSTLNRYALPIDRSFHRCLKRFPHLSSDVHKHIRLPGPLLPESRIKLSRRAIPDSSDSSESPETEITRPLNGNVASAGEHSTLAVAETVGPTLPEPETSAEDSVQDWLTPWDVPWGVTRTFLTMLGWVASFLLSEVVVQLLALSVGWTPWRGHLGIESDDQALFILANQVVRTAAGIAVVWTAVRPFQPLPQDFFSFRVSKPFDIDRGWLLWSGTSFGAALLLVNLEAMVETFIKGGEAPRDSADALVQLLPIIGASPISTASLIIIAGVCAPILEETIFRGFLMTSLTKWMPVPLAVLLSAFAFSAAHLSPNEFFKLATLGVVLGFSYSRTRNLLTPMLIHGVWNSGVIIVLTLLRLNGFDIQELIE